MAPLSLLVPAFGVLAALVKYGAGPVQRRYEVLGFGRSLNSIENVHGSGRPEPLEGTLFSEDLHFHRPSGTLFGIAQRDVRSRDIFFPPTETFNVDGLDQAYIFTIEPIRGVVTPLELVGFSGPWISHGFDLYTPPSQPDVVYIFAINHLPNPDYVVALNTPEASSIHKARSQIEVFEHRLGSAQAVYLRSIRHPLIRTPNDVLVLDEHNIYVSNDYHTREGFGRMIENVGWHELASWSDIVYVKVPGLTNADEAMAQTAIDKIHNPNGLGHGETDDEILIVRCSAGILLRASPVNPAAGDYNLTITSSTELPNTLDNPAYFHDPFAAETGRDASGYVLAGMLRGVDFPDKAELLPSSTWLLGRDNLDTQRRLIFQDNGSAIKMASTSVLVAINPEFNMGKKEAWLYVVSPLALAAIRTKIEL